MKQQCILVLLIFIFSSLTFVTNAQDIEQYAERETAVKPNPEQVEKFYQDYIDLLNRILEAKDYQEFLELYDENFVELRHVAEYSYEYFPRMTPGQTENLDTLIKTFEKKIDLLHNEEIFSNQEDIEKPLEDIKDIDEKLLNEYISCLESQIRNTLLPSNSLFYLADYYLNTVRDTCSYNLSGISYETLEDYLNDDQHERLNQLLFMCREKYNDVLNSSRFETSPDVVINEINNSSNLLADITTKDEFRLYYKYLLWLIDFLVDESYKPKALTDEQKEDCLKAIFKYVRKEYLMNLAKNGAEESFRFETLDDLIVLAENFQTNILSKVEWPYYMDEKDRKYSTDMQNHLKAIIENEFIYIFIDAVRLEKIVKLEEEYNEKM